MASAPTSRHWKLDGYHFHDRHVHYEEMNWKLLVDTFHEGYHFGFLHKESPQGILVHNVGALHAVRVRTSASCSGAPSSTG